MNLAPGYLLPLLRHRRSVVILHLVLAVVMLPGVMLLQQDNSPEVFFVRDAEALEQYRDLELQFGRDRTFRIVLRGDAVWTREGLDWIGQLERAAPDLYGVIGAAGPHNHHRWRLASWPPDDPQSLRREMLRDPLDRDAGWISADGQTVTVLVALYKLPADKQRQVLARFDGLLGAAPPGIDVTVVGLPALNRAMDDALQDIATVFLPLLLLAAALLLSLSLRRIQQVAMLFLLVGFCQLVVFGAMGYLGVSLNLITIILSPLLMVITLATATHVLICYRRFCRQGLDSETAVLETFRIKSWPVIWTGVTTATGFGSLMIARVPPVMALGAWSAAAIGLMTLTLLTLFPALLAGQTAKAGEPAAAPAEQWARRRGRAWASWAVAHRAAVMGCFAAAVAILLAGALQLKVETNLREYFHPQHPMRVAMQDLEDAGIGSLAVELVLVGGSVGSGVQQQRFDDPAKLEQLSALSAALRSLGPVRGVVSAGDLVDAVAHYAPPGQDHESRFAWAMDQIRGSPQQQRMLDHYLTRDADRARVSVFVPMQSHTQLEPLFDDMRAMAGQHFPDAVVQVSGQYPLVLAAQRTLLRTMILSLSLTVLVIALVLRIILGSLQLALRALVPNIWPVVLVLGVMGWAGVPIDSTTVMIAAVVLGLAVDDTLQLLGEFRSGPPAPSPQAAIQAVSQVAGAHMLTSLVLAVGFGILAFSSFVPVARFGALTALALVAALIADLLLVPALLAAVPDSMARKFRLSGGEK